MLLLRACSLRAFFSSASLAPSESYAIISSWGFLVIVLKRIRSGCIGDLKTLLLSVFGVYSDTPLLLCGVKVSIPVNLMFFLGEAVSRSLGSFCVDLDTLGVALLVCFLWGLKRFENLIHYWLSGDGTSSVFLKSNFGTWILKIGPIWEWAKETKWGVSTRYFVSRAISWLHDKSKKWILRITLLWIKLYILSYDFQIASIGLFFLWSNSYRGLGLLGGR